MEHDPERGDDATAWPYALPAVAALLRDGLDLDPGVTFLLELGREHPRRAVAQAYGLGVEGGSRGALHRTREGESPLVATHSPRPTATCASCWVEGRRAPRRR